MNSFKELTTLPNELDMNFHSRYPINVFQINEMLYGDTSTITARGSAGITAIMRIGDVGLMMHDMDLVRKG